MRRSESLPYAPYHARLLGFINGDISWREWVTAGCRLTPRVFRQRAPQIIRQREGVFAAAVARPKAHEVSLVVGPYPGDNEFVQQLSAYLVQHIDPDCFDAFVHGSLGTCEEVPYSDFDAMVILRSKLFQSADSLAEAAYRLCASQRYMRRHDPLQHHGWFVLDEAMLGHYPEHYFPSVLWRHAKCVSSRMEPRCLRLSAASTPQDYQAGFTVLASGIEQEIRNGHYLRNTYRFKSFLSKMLLLPAVYLQARDQQGVFKRESFATAAQDFSARDWEIVRRASAIRRSWDVQVGTIRRELFRGPGPFGRWTQRHFAPRVPRKLRGQIAAPDFSAATLRLLAAMRTRLDHPVCPRSVDSISRTSLAPGSECPDRGKNRGLTPSS